MAPEAEDEVNRPLPVQGPLSPIARQWGLDQLGLDANLRFDRNLVPVVLVGDATRARFQAWGQRWTLNATSPAVAVENSIVEFVAPPAPACLIITEVFANFGAALGGWGYTVASQITAGLAAAAASAIDPAALPGIANVGSAAVILLGAGALPGGVNLVSGEPAVLFPAQRFTVYRNDQNVALVVSAKGYIVQRDSGHNLRDDNGPGR